MSGVTPYGAKTGPATAANNVVAIGLFVTLFTTLDTALVTDLNALPKPNSGRPVAGLIGICSRPAA